MAVAEQKAQPSETLGKLRVMMRHVDPSKPISDEENPTRRMRKAIEDARDKALKTTPVETIFNDLIKEIIPALQQPSDAAATTALNNALKDAKDKLKAALVDPNDPVPEKDKNAATKANAAMGTVLTSAQSLLGTVDAKELTRDDAQDVTNTIRSVAIKSRNYGQLNKAPGIQDSEKAELKQKKEYLAQAREVLQSFRRERAQEVQSKIREINQRYEDKLKDPAITDENRKKLNDSREAELKAIEPVESNEAYKVQKDAVDKLAETVRVLTARAETATTIPGNDQAGYIAKANEEAWHPNRNYFFRPYDPRPDEREDHEKNKQTSELKTRNSASPAPAGSRDDTADEEALRAILTEILHRREEGAGSYFKTDDPRYPDLLIHRSADGGYSISGQQRYFGLVESFEKGSGFGLLLDFAMMAQALLREPFSNENPCLISMNLRKDYHVKQKDIQHLRLLLIEAHDRGMSEGFPAYLSSETVQLLQNLKGEAHSRQWGFMGKSGSDGRLETEIDELLALHEIYKRPRNVGEIPAGGLTENNPIDGDNKTVMEFEGQPGDASVTRMENKIDAEEPTSVVGIYDQPTPKSIASAEPLPKKPIELSAETLRITKEEEAHLPKIIKELRVAPASEAPEAQVRREAELNDAISAWRLSRTVRICADNDNCAFSAIGSFLLDKFRNDERWREGEKGAKLLGAFNKYYGTELDADGLKRLFESETFRDNPQLQQNVLARALRENLAPSTSGPMDEGIFDKAGKEYGFNTRVHVVMSRDHSGEYGEYNGNVTRMIGNRLDDDVLELAAQHNSKGESQGHYDRLLPTPEQAMDHNTKFNSKNSGYAKDDKVADSIPLGSDQESRALFRRAVKFEIGISEKNAPRVG